MVSYLDEKIYSHHQGAHRTSIIIWTICPNVKWRPFSGAHILWGLFLWGPNFGDIFLGTMFWGHNDTAPRVQGQVCNLFEVRGGVPKSEVGGVVRKINLGEGGCLGEESSNF